MTAIKQILGAGLMVLLFVFPLAWGLSLLAPGLFDASSFKALFAHPQFGGALRLTLFTGVISSMLAFILAVIIVMGAGSKLLSRSGVFLAVPHLALALGLGFLFAPTGLLARMLVGGAIPPSWQLVQDPSGVGLIAALTLKEAPFLIWAMVSVIQSDALRMLLSQHVNVARSLGHRPLSVFMKVVLPQILPRVIWPLVAVFSYGMTVVDMALVIGPAQPPTLAQLVWTDLNDGESASNARGAAGTVFLSGLIALILALVWSAIKVSRPMLRYILTRPSKVGRDWKFVSTAIWQLWLFIYAAVIVALALQSVTLLWPYPDLMAQSYSLKAWASAVDNFSSLLLSFVLGVSTSLVALLATLAWLETQSLKRDRIALGAAFLVLCLPTLLVSLGQYRLLLQLGLTGTWGGLFWAHLLPVTAYVFVMLQGPYRGFDPRWQMASNGLGAAHLRFLMLVKWPMLKGPILSATAIGFAVSVAQFVPAQLAAAGRFSTLPMEAVTLSSGGNRALISVYGLLLMFLPLVGFLNASWLSKSRWRDA